MTISDWSRTQLQDGGWIRRMFMEGLRLREQFGEDAVADLSLGQPLDAGEAVANAFHAAIADTFPGRFGYMPNLGYPEVRERTALDVSYSGITAANIAMTQGAAAAICLALRCFVDPGDEVVGVAPYFPEFRFYCETAATRFVPVLVGDDLRLDLEAIAAALSPRTAAVLVNSPSNPSGHMLDSDELSGLAALLERHNAQHRKQVLLIVDEVYHRFVYEPHQRVEPFLHYERTVLARSFSKDLGVAGERIGYLVLHPALARPDTHLALAQAMRALGFVNGPATAQRMLLHLDSWDLHLRPYAERRELVMRLAREAGLDAAEPQGGFYLWVRSPEDDTLAFIDALARRCVLLTPGVAFGVPTHLRLCFSAPREKLAMAMDAVSDLMRARVSA